MPKQNKKTCLFGQRYDIFMRMEIILFFQSTGRISWQKKLSGVHRYAREHNWFAQVVGRLSLAKPNLVHNAFANAGQLWYNTTRFLFAGIA